MGGIAAGRAALTTPDVFAYQTRSTQTTAAAGPAWAREAQQCRPIFATITEKIIVHTAPRCLAAIFPKPCFKRTDQYRCRSNFTLRTVQRETFQTPRLWTSRRQRFNRTRQADRLGHPTRAGSKRSFRTTGQSARLLEQIQSRHQRNQTDRLKPSKPFGLVFAIVLRHAQPGP